MVRGHCCFTGHKAHVYAASAAIAYLASKGKVHGNLGICIIPTFLYIIYLLGVSLADMHACLFCRPNVEGNSGLVELWLG